MFLCCCCNAKLPSGERFLCCFNFSTYSFPSLVMGTLINSAGPVSKHLIHWNYSIQSLIFSFHWDVGQINCDNDCFLWITSFFFFFESFIIKMLHGTDEDDFLVFGNKFCLFKWNYEIDKITMWLWHFSYSPPANKRKHSVSSTYGWGCSHSWFS